MPPTKDGVLATVIDETAGPPAAGRLRMLRSLRHRDYRWFWFSGFGQALGQGMMQLTVAWLVLTLTDSLAQFGLVVFLQGVPMLGFVLFGGVMADRLDRKKVLMGSQVVMAAIIVVLAVLVQVDAAVLWHVYATSVATGIIAGLSMPARTSYVRSLVTREDLMNAVGLNAMLMNASRIVGPSLAGGIIEYTGIANALFVNGAFFMAGTVAMVPIRGGAVQRSSKTSAAGDLAHGLGYAWRTPAVRALIMLTLALGLLGMVYVQVTPAFAKEVLHLGAGGAGLLAMAGGIGALAGSVGLVTLADAHHKGRVLITLALVFPVALLAFALTPWFAMAIIALALLGLASTMTISLVNAIIQLVVPQELVGRVSSLMLGGASMMFVGTLPLGYLGDRVGLREALAGSAAVLLGVAVSVTLMWSPLRRLRV